MRRTTFQEEIKIFELRRTAIELKRKLNIKDTDEDLISKVDLLPRIIALVLLTLTVVSPNAKERKPQHLKYCGYLFDRMESHQMRTCGSCLLCVRKKRREEWRHITGSGRSNGLLQSTQWSI
jgi:hypothetical protein